MKKSLLSILALTSLFAVSCSRSTQEPARPGPDAEAIRAIVREELERCRKAEAGTAAQAPEDVPAGGTKRDLIDRCVRILRFGSVNTVWEPGKKDAILTLGLLGAGEATPVLLDHLRNEKNQHVRCEIVRALGWIGDARAEDALIASMLNDGYKHVRGLSALSLGALGSSKAVPALETTLEDEDFYVRKYASESLEKLTGKTYAFEGR